MPIKRPTLPRYSTQRCCPERTVPFTDQEESNVPYLGEFGDNPTVTVLYNVDGTWTLKGVMTPIELQGNPIDNIYVNHGEESTGIIKIS